MTTIVWDKPAARSFRRVLKRNPALRESVKETLAILAQDPFHPRLGTHKLKGKLAGSWACSAAGPSQVDATRLVLAGLLGARLVEDADVLAYARQVIAVVSFLRQLAASGCGLQPCLEVRVRSKSREKIRSALGAGL